MSEQPYPEMIERAKRALWAKGVRNEAAKARWRADHLGPDTHAEWVAMNEAPVVDDRDVLRAAAEALGIEVDPRWGLTRLQIEIERAAFFSPATGAAREDISAEDR